MNLTQKANAELKKSALKSAYCVISFIGGSRIDKTKLW